MGFRGNIGANGRRPYWPGLWLAAVLLAASVLLALVPTPARATATDWDAVLKQLQAAQQMPAAVAERQQRIEALRTAMPADPPYAVQRELLLARIGVASFAERARLVEALRALAQAHGDDDTADWMAVRHIFDTHSDHNIRASLQELDAVRLRIDEGASLQLREAIETSYAFMYWDVASFELAMRHLLRSRELLAKMPQQAPDSLPMRGIQLARLYLDMDDPAAAQDELANLRSEYGSHWSLPLRVAWTTSQASALRQLGQLQQSRGLLEALLPEADAMDGGNEAMRVRVELLRTLLEAGDNAAALQVGTQLQQVQAQAGNWFSATIDVLHGQALARSGKLEQGLALMQRGIGVFETAAHVLALNDALARKVDVLRSAGRTREALEALQERNDLSMRMFQNSRALGLASMQVEQQLAERERRIVQLSGENQLQRQNLASERTRNLLLLGGLVALTLVATLLALLLRSSSRQREALWKDGLSKAYTRPYLAHWLSRHPLRAGNTRWLLLLDLDHFKAINDSHGHACGDEVLRITGERLRQALPPNAELFRWGGEEFLAIIDLPTVAAGVDAIEPAAKRLLQAVNAEPMPCGSPAQPLSVSASLGGAMLLADDADLSRTLAWADVGLYMAKAQGRRMGVLVGPVQGHPASPPRQLDALLARIEDGQAWARRVLVGVLVRAPDQPTPSQSRGLR